MQIGDIVFFNSRSLVGKIISYFTNSPYSHVALVVGENEIIEADRFIKVRTRKLTSDEIVYVKEVGTYLSPDQKSLLVASANHYLNKRYDYKAILSWVMRLAFRVEFSFVDNANQLICSELIDRSYMAIGIDLVPDRKTGDVTPYHLLVSDVERIIKGEIQNGTTKN